MRVPLLLALVAAAVAAPLAAQTPGCPADTVPAGRICQAGADALTLFLPVEGVLVSGGNPVPGTAGALGRFGRFRLAGRVGLVQVTIPSTSYSGASDTVPADTRQLVAMPRVDLDVGVFSKVLPIGTAAIDLLGSTVVLPMGLSSRYQVDQNAHQVRGLALGFGFGLRAALLMAGNRPSVSLSVMKRSMPSLRFGDRARGDQMSIATNLSAINARLTVGGRLGPLQLTGGGGMDMYSGTGSVTFADSASGTDSTIAVSLSSSRITTLLNAAVSLGPLTLWGEGGFLLGKAEPVVTHFERIDPAGGQFYGGAGVALTF
jgi:hypothetical protein